MHRPLPAGALVLIAPAMLVGCSSAAATAKVTPTPTARPAATSTPVAATPSPPPGPYAVIVTNGLRQGSTYDVLLIDVLGHVISKVTAKLPLLKPNQVLQLPLVSASNDLVYYLDGDTEIHSLSPTGAAALVKTIPQGSSSNLGFAVSPDDQRIAVSLINQSADASKDSGHGYVEDLADGGNHVNLFSNTAPDALRWPVGWDGDHVIDGAGGQCGPYGYGTGNASPCSFHVVSSTTASRTATVCESPSVQPPNESDTDSVNGLPVAAGIACTANEYYYNGNTTPPSAKLLAVDWSGRETTFLTGDKNGQIAYGNCFLAPGGAQMACTANTSQALTLLARGTPPQNLGRRYTVLGWIDGTHIAVDINSTTLGVLSTASGAVVNLAQTDADKTVMIGAMPGAL
jgi:hypothetical protein